ncbi:MAG: GNAT family N-acetyltransferase [Rhodococcus sp.]|uniref:GNAT family N-acetyltransferase n=1 Tax=Rhodococcus TaxID=1827 RepID=UPI0016B13F02|nr:MULTISPECIES: GNAT family N-acetyltransferase [Rhodococcus]NLV77829.1 GNAT family N-acetyltransferase [Rhodococcus sp. (in: high G+C Gram-positive bacteria)]
MAATHVIERADFDDTGLTGFLEAHLSDIAPTAPATSRHALNIAELMDSSVRLWVVRQGSDVVATGALALLEPGHEELKSMRTAPELRGQGIARLLLEHLLLDAKMRGVARVSLETGSMDFFEPARRLYLSSGFVPCGPFGCYEKDPNSVFMTLAW